MYVSWKGECMEKFTMSREKRIIVQHEIKVGDIVGGYDRWENHCTGVITAIYDKGNQCILNNQLSIWTNTIFEINGEYIN